MILLSSLMLLVAGFTVVAGILLVPDGLPAIGDVTSVVGISVVPFDLSVAGGPTVTGFLLPMAFLLLLVNGVPCSSWRLYYQL
jgi:hypothetical protein